MSQTRSRWSFFSEQECPEERLKFPNEQGQYNSRVMVRHWIDDRQEFERVHPLEYQSVTKRDYVVPQPILPTENEIRGHVYLKCQGQKHQFLFADGGKAFVKNYVTTYDQDFHQFPKLEIDGVAKKYMKPWQIENKLKETKCLEPWKQSPKEAHSDRAPGYETETYASYRPVPKEALLSGADRHAVPRDLSVDFFKPNIPNKKYPIFEKGYPAFAIPEYTSVPPQLTKAMDVADKPDFMSFKPLLSTRFVGHEGR